MRGAPAGACAHRAAARSTDPRAEGRAGLLARARIDRRQKPAGPADDRRYRPPDAAAHARAHRPIPAGDPRNELIITGDIRYNVIEWDLVNKASYGGLGPSIAHQLTGETVSGNVLIQGPEIIAIYQRWFTASQNARDLRERGMLTQADEVMRDAKVEIDTISAANRGVTRQRKLTMGQGLEFRIVADMPQLRDDPRIEFDAWPSGVSFSSYMSGNCAASLSCDQLRDLRYPTNIRTYRN